MSDLVPTPRNYNHSNADLTTAEQDNNHMSVTQSVEQAKTLRVDNSKKQEEQARAAIMDLLAAASGNLTTNENGIGYHVNDGSQPLISIRTGTSPARAAKFLNQYVISQAQEAVYELPPEIKCRPMDGAVNINSLLRKIYGMGSVGLEQRSFFGTVPPMTRTVEVGFNEHISVPWGLIAFPDFEGELYLGEKNDPDYGVLFHAWIKCPKKYEPQVEGFWKMLQDQIKNNSIYKGKAIVGVGKMTRDGSYEHPKFLDVNAIDPAKVAYTQEVFDRLRSSVWGPIKTADLQRLAGMKLNRKTLLFGPYGTGKSLAGGLTAQVAVEEGWTFIQSKTGDEDLNMVLRTAEMLAPSIVFIEDIDILIESDPKKMAELLEQFDGVSSKNKEVMVLMTSNHVASLSKGMTRVGRIDAAIEVGSLDREAIMRLINATFDEDMLGDDIDWNAIHQSMEGYEPAFIMGTFNLTKSNAIIRTGSLHFRLTTEDFTLAAETLRNQHDTHSTATDRPEADRLGMSFEKVVAQAATEALQGHRVDFRENGDIIAAV